MRRTYRAWAVVALGAATLPGIGRGEGVPALADVIDQSKLIVAARVRFENVDQEPFVEEGKGSTLRTVLGFETGKIAATSLLVEGESVWSWRDDYRGDGSRPQHAQFPVITDPESEEINRLQLTNTSLPATTAILGRQRIVLDDHRFFGSSPWRQNEQTFDGLRLVNRGISNLNIDVAYLNQANRVFGPDSPQGRYEGDIYLANLAYQTKPAKITGFAYLLDFDPLTGFPGLTAAQAAALNPVRVSTATYGARLSGEQGWGKVKLGYVGSYATQRDYGANPQDLSLQYSLLELTGSYRQFGLGIGYEVLEGNGIAGFSTPLATLHRFQGWTDKFLTTPPDGIEDRYVNLAVNFKNVSPFETLSCMLSYHTYDAERISQSYGDEVNVQLQAKWQRFTAIVKYADYRAGGFLTDTAKLWVQFEYAR